MKQILTALITTATIVNLTAPLGAQQSPRPGEGVAPAAVRQPCTDAQALRGAAVAPPKGGDVATVPQLCAGGVSVASLPHAPIILPPATTVDNPELVRDQSLPPLVALGAPASTAIDIRTVNGNWTHLFSGAFWHAPAITPHGELQAIDSGHARFSVAAALGYFAVAMPRFLARVKGTIFDVDFEPGQSATFSVSEGTVAVVRISAIHLIEENRTVDGIRETDKITAGGKSSVTYKLPLHVERNFKNADEANKVLNEELQAATVDGDPEAIDDALNNIQLVSGKPLVGFNPAHAGQGASSGAPGAASGGLSAGTLAAAGILAATIGLVADKALTSPSTSAPTIATGSATLKAVNHAAKPSPSPSPTEPVATAATPPKGKGH